jgi:hypothetical protein
MGHGVPVQFLRIGVSAVVFSILVLIPGFPGASAARRATTFKVPAVADIFIRADASHGYKLTLWAHRVFLSREDRSDRDATVVLTVRRDGESAIYIPPARMGADTVRAWLGKLGTVAVRFEPRTVQISNPGNGCKGAKTVTKHGVFRGQFRFRGEGGYTSLDFQRLWGSVVRRPEQTCWLTETKDTRQAVREWKVRLTTATPTWHSAPVSFCLQAP